ncbi:MAG: hypothetical protein ACJ79H_05055 [Myxococcales bacterium]
MRLLWICVVSSLACASTTQARPPLSADQVERLDRQVKDRVVRVELASNAVAPVALELRRIEFAPEFLRGTAADGPRAVPLREVASLKWRTRGAGALLGLLVGPPAGALVGVGIGALLSHSCGPGCNDGETQALNMLGGVVVGGLAGLVLGPVVGAVVRDESRIDFAPRSEDLPSRPSAPAAPNPNLNE